MVWFNKFRITSIIFIIFVIMHLVIDMKSDNDYDKEYIDNDSIKCHKQKKNKILKKLVKQEEQPLSGKLIASCKSGLLTGCVAGSVNGLSGAISSGAIYGVSNMIVTYINHN
jgi:hypothetical protein